MSIFLIPLAWIEKCLSPPEAAVDWFGKKPDLPFSVFVHVLYAGAAWGGNVVLWVVALKYTSSVHASLITSTQPMILCIYYQIIGIHISRTEWLGMLLSMSGIAIASMSKLLPGGHESDQDEDVIVHSNSVKEEILGDALCLLSAVFEVFILINRNKVKPYVPLMMVSEKIVDIYTVT
jgi:drug/metabolite transporter (DMT)-like permease